LELNDKRILPQVFAEYRGVTDDGRNVTIVNDGVLTQEYLCSIGFSCNQQTHAVWKDAERVLAGQVPRVMATDAVGWVLVPNADGSFDRENAIPHYVHGGRVIAPKGAPELVSTRIDQVGRSTSKVGSFEGWKQSNALALRNPMMAVLEGGGGLIRHAQHRAGPRIDARAQRGRLRNRQVASDAAPRDHDRLGRQAGGPEQQVHFHALGRHGQRRDRRSGRMERLHPAQG
jgi:hypothetical protein